MSQYFSYFYVIILCAAVISVESNEIVKEMARKPIQHYKDECGKVASSDTFVARIRGGQPADNKQFPWMALVMNYKSVSRCGGSVIGPRHVLTAAHCFQNQDTATELEKRSYFVFIGDVDKELMLRKLQPHKKRCYCGCGGEEIFMFKAVDVRIHPNYQPKDEITRISRNDLAIVVVDRDIKISSLIRPICLPDADLNNNFENYQSLIMGWGDIAYNDLDFEVFKVRYLNVARALIRSLADCKKFWNDNINEKRICVGNEITNVCSGDSGGPVVIRNDADGKYYEVGLMIRAQCGEDGRPALCERITAYKIWIDGIVEETLEIQYRKEIVLLSNQG